MHLHHPVKSYGFISEYVRIFSYTFRHIRSPRFLAGSLIDCIRIRQHAGKLIELLKQQIRLTQYSTRCVILQLGKCYQQIADYMTQSQTRVVQ